jgi:hypothetical protein
VPPPSTFKKPSPPPAVLQDVVMTDPRPEEGQDDFPHKTEEEILATSLQLSKPSSRRPFQRGWSCYVSAHRLVRRAAYSLHSKPSRRTKVRCERLRGRLVDLLAARLRKCRWAVGASSTYHSSFSFLSSFTVSFIIIIHCPFPRHPPSFLPSSIL